MNPRGARFLRDTGNELFHLFAHNHHHVSEFIDDDDNARQFLQRGMNLLLPRQLENRVWFPHRIRDGITVFLRIEHLAVIAL